jgi:4-amino-4-deoxy-L-arabinose transferase-like glycosyltransferase
MRWILVRYDLEVFRPGLWRAVSIVLAVIITAYGALLRVDALVERYGTVDHPGWARVLTNGAPRWAAPLKPEPHQWRRIAQPYVGGDPINYLRYAREMQTFYQPHVREPVFLAWTRGFLWLLSDQDIAISFASAAASTLAIAGACLLAWTLVSPLAGLLAALLIATEYELITWAPDGWRDDTFMAAVVFAAWACVRLHRRPTFGNAVLVGATTGVACLTRITALSFVLPALLVVVVDAPRAEWRHRAMMTGLAALICAALVAPFLVSCAVATGDPFYAINYHTSYYRFGEGLPAEQPQSTASYLSAKLAGHPVRVIDTVLVGLFVQPFTTRFHGYEGYAPHIGAAVAWCAAAGLLMWPFVSAGRMLLVILFTSLVPYAFTWNVASGGEWRFTMHAYPLYIAAALFAVDRAWRFVLALWRPRGRLTLPSRPRLTYAAGVAMVAALLWGLYSTLPWFVVREAIAHREDVSIETGPRDGLFFGAGWSRPHRDGVLVRVSQDDRAIVRFPLPVRRDYDIVLRLDPATPELQRRATILLNRQLLGSVFLRFDPMRMGSYRLRLPEHQVRVGANELTILPETIVTAGSAGPRFDWLDPADRIGVRLWYMRVLAPQ